MVIEKYKEATPSSKKLWERAVNLFCGGVNHNIRTFGLDNCGAYPPYIARGNGSHVWDVDGNEYIDWWMTHYSQILGHNNQAVREALAAQIEKGIHFGGLNEQMVQLAERLREGVSFLKKMRFCSTGSEATMYATRLARLFTKKKLVAKTLGGWHGGNDALAYHLKSPYTDDPFFNGISFNFNDRDSFDKLMNENGDDLAAVVIEPVLGAGGAVPPDNDFLPYIREETESRDILLIFDEIITGFRFSYGSAGEKEFGVVPDIMTMGKIVGGGMHLGIYGGREDVMHLATPDVEGGRWVGGGTFSSHPLAMTAGCETLDQLREMKDKYPALNKSCTDFRNEINKLFDDYEYKAISTGHGSLIYIHALHNRMDGPPRTGTDIGNELDPNALDKFQSLLMQEGIFGFHGLGAMSFSHTKKDIEKTLDAINHIVTK
ncbi:MAG: aspartate aminotransferase family protein [Candidatus Thorarchaeota archaeon]|jgi:glutamate-1-semialdehyde 2,1-aminomutase